MSAEILRRAAALMRERAEAATEGPWTTWAETKPGIDKAAVETAWTRGDPEDGGSLVTDWCDVPDAEHIASWHPDVALAVAPLLLALAARADEIADSIGSERVATSVIEGTLMGYVEAVTFARAYLGEQA